jgi:hypothetical protein
VKGVVAHTSEREGFVLLFEEFNADEGVFSTSEEE